MISVLDFATHLKGLGEKLERLKTFIYTEIFIFASKNYFMDLEMNKIPLFISTLFYICRM